MKNRFVRRAGVVVAGLAVLTVGFGSTAAMAAAPAAPAPAPVAVVQNVAPAITDVQTWTYVTGPLETTLTLDTTARSASIVVYANVPLLGKVKVGSASGSLAQGITFHLGLSPFVNGTQRFYLVGDDVHLYYDFDALGKHYTGDVKLGTLPPF
ncbi:hypothetical protein P3T27_002534 [Kitasatospora sp. MAA19]|uniref:hypothetical protein n=1 Tax=Kitasatospora sp. MAA19 TaxID=3035090 RepID=UPI00247398AA|nr:hypothetical protein [Kitasatospora sp. MAA19]MDH6705812.1 hypothetical protein [Kitasatospora sp. MAA19]